MAGEPEALWPLRLRVIDEHPVPARSHAVFRSAERALAEAIAVRTGTDARTDVSWRCWPRAPTPRPWCRSGARSTWSPARCSPTSVGRRRRPGSWCRAPPAELLRSGTHATVPAPEPTQREDRDDDQLRV